MHGNYYTPMAKMEAGYKASGTVKFICIHSYTLQFSRGPHHARLVNLEACLHFEVDNSQQHLFNSSLSIRTLETV